MSFYDRIQNVIVSTKKRKKKKKKKKELISKIQDARFKVLTRVETGVCNKLTCTKKIISDDRAYNPKQN